MNKLLIGGAVAALAAAAAGAQPAPPPGVAPGTTPIAPGAPRMHVMRMSNRTMTRDEVVKHVGKLFARLDANRDGYLTREEINAAHEKMGAMHGDFVGKRLADRGMPNRGAAFDRLDANHDGSISRQEYMAAQPQLQERRVMVMHDGAEGALGAPGDPGMKMHRAGMSGFGGRLFDMADGNHDGRVSLAEAQTAALAHFDRADLNHDGTMTPDERSQAHQLMHGRHRPS
jgi:hypothetical protein